VGTNNGEIDSSYTNIDLTLSTYTFNETTFALAPMLGRTISADQSYMYGGAFGGVVGVNNGTIKESYSSGVIKDLVVFDGVDQSGNASSFQTLGGFAGYNAGLIQDAYSTTGLYAQGGLNTNLTAGSFVGENANSGVINNVLTTGVVIGTASEFGSNSGLISNSFYDMATTGSNYSNDATAGCFNKETGCAPVNGVAPVNLTQAATYTAAGWDLTNVWHITEGGTLPYLVSISGANAPAIVVGYTTPNANPQASSIYTIQVQGQELSTGANGFYYGLATAPAAIIVPVDPANLPSAPAEAKDHWWNQGMTTAMMESDLNNPLMPNQNIIDYTRGMSEQQQHADLSIVQHTQVNSSCGSSKSLEAKATLCSLSVQVQK
jgi:hypothetical protein